MQSYHSIQLDEDIYSLIQFCSLFEWFDYENIFLFKKSKKRKLNIWIFKYLIGEKRVNWKVVTSSHNILYKNKNCIAGISHASYLLK